MSSDSVARIWPAGRRLPTPALLVWGWNVLIMKCLSSKWSSVETYWILNSLVRKWLGNEMSRVPIAWVSNDKQPLDRGEDTFVTSLDITGDFDRVWHEGITTKLRSMRICGDLLHPLQDQRANLLRTLTVERILQRPAGAGLWSYIIYRRLYSHIPQWEEWAPQHCRLHYLDAAEDRLLEQEMASYICPSGNPSHAHLSKTRCHQLGPKHHFPWRQENSPPGVSQHPWGWVQHWPYVYQKVAKDAAWKLSYVRRIAHLLNAQGMNPFYKSSVRYLIENSPLASSSCLPPTWPGCKILKVHRMQVPQRWPVVSVVYRAGGVTWWSVATK